MNLIIEFVPSYFTAEEVNMQNKAHFQYFDDMMALLGDKPAASIVC